VKNYISICKNIIQQNNKRNWVDPQPTIRISNTPSGKVQKRCHAIGIVDAEGKVVAKLISTMDGKPIIKCGAKVALITDYQVIEIA